MDLAWHRSCDKNADHDAKLADDALALAQRTSHPNSTATTETALMKECGWSQHQIEAYQTRARTRKRPGGPFMVMITELSKGLKDPAMLDAVMALAKETQALKEEMKRENKRLGGRIDDAVTRIEVLERKMGDGEALTLAGASTTAGTSNETVAQTYPPVKACYGSATNPAGAIGKLDGDRAYVLNVRLAWVGVPCDIVLDVLPGGFKYTELYARFETVTMAELFKATVDRLFGDFRRPKDGSPSNDRHLTAFKELLVPANARLASSLTPLLEVGDTRLETVFNLASVGMVVTFVVKAPPGHSFDRVAKQALQLPEGREEWVDDKIDEEPNAAGGAEGHGDCKPGADEAAGAFDEAPEVEPTPILEAT